MRAILERKVTQAKENEWRLKWFKGKETLVKDLAAPAVSILKWVDEYIGPTISANPYASIAWAGVSVLFPVSSSSVSPRYFVRIRL